MKRLYKYTLTRFLRNFLVIIGIFSLVIISSQLLNLPSSVYRTNIFYFLQVLLFLNLSFFKIQLISSYLIASILTGYSFRETREIYAIYSTGISKKALFVPIGLVTVFITIFAYISSFFLVPWANRERSKIYTISVREHLIEEIQEKNFFTLDKNMVIYVHNKEKYQFNRIFIYNKDKGQIVSAKEGIIKGNGIILKNGFIQIPQEKSFNALKFGEYQLFFDIKYVKRYSINYYKNSELIKIFKSGSQNAFKALSILVDRFNYGLAFLFLGFLGFAMGIAFYKDRDMLIAIGVVILVVYTAIGFYFAKLIEKGSINPAFYPIFTVVFLGFLTWYFYRKP
ncbi:MAG: LptF/LptG family permease [Aquificae bacterium]|nr:LptF/LptG family permease [Aquificota bacterium]